MSDPADLAVCDLTQLTPYAVQLRYDSSFWPDQRSYWYAK
jgi:hypothetical protein